MDLVWQPNRIKIKPNRSKIKPNQAKANQNRIKIKPNRNQNLNQIKSLIEILMESLEIPRKILIKHVGGPRKSYNNDREDPRESVEILEILEILGSLGASLRSAWGGEPPPRSPAAAASRLRSPSPESLAPLLPD